MDELNEKILDAYNKSILGINEAMSVPDKHQLAIAKKTLKMSDAGANIMGGMSKKEAVAFLKKIGYSDAKIKKMSEEAIDVSDLDEYLLNEGKGGWLEVARQVLKKHQMVYINPKNNETSDEKKRGFVILDATTANMLVTIADALSKESNEKFTSMPLANAINIGWKLIK